MRFRLLSLLIALALALVVTANIEKRVFLGPNDSNSPQLQQWRNSLIEQGIEVLSAEKPTLRRKIHAAFPHSPPGIFGEPQEAWILLDDLEPGRRYELKISFSAMQPNSQNLTAISFADVWKDEALRQDLDKYLQTRESHKVPSTTVPEHQPESQLAFFVIKLEPDYFTIDQKMMTDGILVEFDFVLDPYVWNILPKSTVPLSIYITILACIAFPLSGLVWRTLLHVARLETETKARAGGQNKDD